MLDTAFLYNVVNGKRRLSEAKEEFVDLQMELEKLDQDYTDFGVDSFYSVPFKKFKEANPEFTDKCIIDYLKAMGILVGDELKNNKLLEKHWPTGQLIIQEDWPILFEGANLIINGRELNWKKLWKEHQEELKQGEEPEDEEQTDDEFDYGDVPEEEQV